MKTWAPILILTTALAAGCQNQQKPQTSASVLDVSAPAPRNNYSQPTGGYQPSNAYRPASNQYSSAPASTTTPPYMLPSAYPPPEPAPAMTVVEAQPPSAVPASTTVKAAARTRSAPNAPANAPPAAEGSSYTVKQGDTLYHIAKVRYGNGNQWQRIATANPGVSPTTLKVGQVLKVP